MTKNFNSNYVFDDSVETVKKFKKYRSGSKSIRLDFSTIYIDPTAQGNLEEIKNWGFIKLLAEKLNANINDVTEWIENATVAQTLMENSKGHGTDIELKIGIDEEIINQYMSKTGTKLNYGKILKRTIETGYITPGFEKVMKEIYAQDGEDIFAIRAFVYPPEYLFNE